MKILLVFPQKSALCSHIEKTLHTLYQAAEILCRYSCFEGKDALDKNDFDLLLLSPSDKDFDGLTLAKECKIISPKTKIIFVADNEKYTLQAFKTRADGYLVKPNEEDLKEEINELCPLEKHAKASAITFGNFDLFANGKAVKFSKSKSKELLAFLIYKRGTSASSSELIVNLWEDKDVDRTTRSMLHNYLSDIRKTLNEYGIADIFSYERNNYRIVKENLDCDYFRFLDGDKKTVFSYAGEYMTGYEWATFTEAELSSMREEI